MLVECTHVNEVLVLTCIVLLAACFTDHQLFSPPSPPPPPSPSPPSLPLSLSPCRSHQTYYMFGFMFVAFIVLLITCAETSILLCYFQLCGEDYNWWWRSFLSSASTAFYLFIFCFHYFIYKMDLENAASVILYFGYSFLFVCFFFTLTGQYFACTYVCLSVCPPVYSSVCLSPCLFVCVYMLTSTYVRTCTMMGMLYCC